MVNEQSREVGERAELESLLASGIFAKAPNLAKLLSYICDRYWKGELESLKEYSLGVEALGRPQSFDPSSNAIVRVEALRLREKLRKYYEAQGAGHEIHISIQPGGYVPQFARNLQLLDQKNQKNGLAPAAPLPLVPIGVVSRPNRALIIAVLMAAVLVAALIVIEIPRGAARIFNSARVAQLGRRAQISAEAPRAGPAPAAAPPGLSGIGILAGYTRAGYTDRNGVQWLGDRYFDGGSAGTNTGRVILGASDPTLFGAYRTGDFTYTIPLKPGNYELWLYFVETLFGPGTNSGGGDGSRMFQVKANGRLLLNDFDIIADAGANFTADERVFDDIHPAPDGYLHLAFLHQMDAPLVDAIRLIPCGQSGAQLPVRIVAQETSYTDRENRVWSPDRFVRGGRLVARRTAVADTADPGLYAGERFGNFTYAIPAAPGKHAVTLYFCEQYFGPGNPNGSGPGSRVFNVTCNGKTLLSDFDVFKEAGGAGRPVVRTFHGIEPDAQGKIVLHFIPVVNYALVNAIDVEDDAR